MGEVNFNTQSSQDLLVAWFGDLVYGLHIYKLEAHDKSPEYFWYGVYFSPKDTGAKCECKLLHNPLSGDDILVKKAVLTAQNLGLIRSY